jgi:hypothetical protein
VKCWGQISTSLILQRLVRQRAGEPVLSGSGFQLGQLNEIKSKKDAAHKNVKKLKQLVILVMCCDKAKVTKHWPRRDLEEEQPAAAAAKK